jgi:hypothetical protein
MRIRAQHAVCEMQRAADSLRQRVGPAEHGKVARHRRIEEHGSAHRQQESRSVSAALTGRGSQASRCAVPGAYTFAADAHGLSRLRLRRPRHDGIDQCASMFAPCLLGCPGTPRQHPVSAAPCGYRATAQNGSSRHVLALFDISSKRRIECRSGLLTAGSGFKSLAAHVFAGLWPALMMPVTGLRIVSVRRPVLFSVRKVRSFAARGGTGLAVYVLGGRGPAGGECVIDGGAGAPGQGLVGEPVNVAFGLA